MEIESRHGRIIKINGPGVYRAVDAKMDSRVAAVLDLISSRFREPWTLELLANHVNLCPSYLDRLFRSFKCKSPCVLLKSMRLEQARILLCSTYLSVKQVAAAVGISDSSHFVKDFKKVYGQTPSVYRQINRESQHSPIETVIGHAAITPD